MKYFYLKNLQLENFPPENFPINGIVLPTCYRQARQTKAGRLAEKVSLFTKFPKSCNLASNLYFQCLNSFSGLTTMYQ